MNNNEACAAYFKENPAYQRCFAEFEKGLQCTKFAPVNFEEVQEAYFGRKMITTQRSRMEEERGKAEFFETVGGYLTECADSDSVVVSWLRGNY